MRALAAILLAIAVPHGAAADAPAKRKVAPDKFAQAAGEAFAAAVKADRAGDLRTALGLYKKAYEISPHASTVYNIADVQRRLSNHADALKHYRAYLVMTPAASDRRDVEALADKLAKLPGTLVVMTEDASNPKAIDWKSAYVLVDGAIKLKPGTAPAMHHGRSGYEIAVPGGSHVVDVVTPITHGQRTCHVDVGGRTNCIITADPRIDGHLVASTNNRDLDVRAERGGRAIDGKRVDLAPGNYKLLVRDRSFHCAPIPVEVPGGADVLYVYAGTSEYKFERCRTLTITQQRLRF